MGKVEIELPVRTYHVDINRHVNNVVYVKWLEVARIRLLETIHLPIEALQARGLNPILLETWIKHHGPLYYPDEARVAVWVSEVTHASAWLDFEMHSKRHGTLAARARQRCVLADATTNRPHRLTSEERAAFERALVPATS